MTSLLQIPPRHVFEVVRIEAEAGLSRRLADMGIKPGVGIEVLGRAPFSGPLIVQAQGATFALREGEAACIHVQAPTLSF